MKDLDDQGSALRRTSRFDLAELEQLKTRGERIDLARMERTMGARRNGGVEPVNEESETTGCEAGTARPSDGARLLTFAGGRAHIRQGDRADTLTNSRAGKRILTK